MQHLWPGSQQCQITAHLKPLFIQQVYVLEFTPNTEPQQNENHIHGSTVCKFKILATTWAPGCERLWYAGTYHTISHGMLVQWSALHLWKSVSVSMNWYGVISVKQKTVCKWVSIVCYFLYNKKSGRNKKVHLLIFAKGILERETRNHRAWKLSGQVDGNRVEWMRKWYSWVTFLYSFDFLEPCLCHILNKYTNALINN